MIRVNAPLKRTAIKDLLDGKTHEGHTFVFVKEEGMRLYFTSSQDIPSSASVARKTIKATEYGQDIYFSVDYIS